MKLTVVAQVGPLGIIDISSPWVIRPQKHKEQEDSVPATELPPCTGYVWYGP